MRRLVVCHLGGGCSVTAVLDGRSVDTTMGFTPLEGVPMATRAGHVDPGALLYLLRHGVALDELETALEHDSGLRGLGGTGDVADLLASTEPAARLALDVFTYRVAQAVVGHGDRARRARRARLHRRHRRARGARARVDR